MADQDPNTGGNGSAAPADGAQFSVLAQYIKDLSVENPSAPQVFQWQAQPSLDVQFHINVDKVADDVHEVSLKIEVTARSENGVHFVVDLNYAGLFGIRSMPEEALAPILLVEAPRLIFPFARQVVADAVSNRVSRRCFSIPSTSRAPMSRRSRPRSGKGIRAAMARANSCGRRSARSLTLRGRTGA